MKLVKDMKNMVWMYNSMSSAYDLTLLSFSKDAFCLRIMLDCKR